jgi:hypothetical protein
MLIASALVLLACGDITLDPLPLDVSIEASRLTAAPGDTILFVVRAQGGNLLGIAIDFGDGSTDEFGTSGARTARVMFRHAYLTTGSFQVQTTVTDETVGAKGATLQVVVN